MTLGIIPVSPSVRSQTENAHTQTARLRTTICRPYNYLFRAGIEPETRSATVGSSATTPTVSSIDLRFHIRDQGCGFSQ